MKKIKHSAREKIERQQKKALFETVFIGGKMRRICRMFPLIDGIPADEFIKNNADPIWLQQNELWHLMDDLQSPDPSMDDDALFDGP